MWFRDTSPTTGMGCTCEGYSFIHRKSSKYCIYRVDGSKRLPGDIDFNDRYTEWWEANNKQEHELEFETVSNDWAEEV
jgi:hypothetical protein